MTRWSKDECERRYVEGEKITLEALSELSGVPVNTLKGWTRGKDNPLAGTWGDRRKRFHSELQNQVRAKTIEKTSDLISDQLSAISLEHYEAYKICREVAEIRAKWMHKRLKEAFDMVISHPELEQSEKTQMELEAKEKALEELNIGLLNLLGLVIDRSIRGERMALGLEYEDINKAIAKVEKTGLKVTLPDDKALLRVRNPQGGQATEEIEVYDLQ